MLRESVAILEAAAESRPNSLAGARLSLGTCLTRLERFEDPERELLAVRRALDALSNSALAEARQVLTALVDLYQAWGKPERAAEYRALLADSEADQSDK